jgi:NAD:arginine ADP-ribosyltransferase
MPIQIVKEDWGLKLIIRDDYYYPISIAGLEGVRKIGGNNCSNWVLQVLDKKWLDNKNLLYLLAQIIHKECPKNDIDWENTFFIVEKKEYLAEDIPNFSKEFLIDKKTGDDDTFDSFMERIQRGFDESTPEVHQTIIEIVLQNLKEYGLPNNFERNLTKYVNERFASILKQIKTKHIGTTITQLTDHEKVLVYKYTLDAYEDLNEDLRAGKESEFELYLNAVLVKLPDFKDLVYRGSALSKAQIARYQTALEQKEKLTELGFTSASKSRQVAEMFSKGNTIFRIISKTGKAIEELSFHGVQSPQNEKEVLFRSKTNFKVLGVKEENGKFLITLEEA